MSNESVYKVKIEGEGLTFEREISKEIGEKILVLILSGGNPSFAMPKTDEALSATSLEDSSAEHKNQSDLSIREFLDEHNAKRNPDIITATALYLSVHEGKSYFTKEDILNAFEAAAA